MVAVTRCVCVWLRSEQEHFQNYHLKSADFKMNRLIYKLKANESVLVLIVHCLWQIHGFHSSYGKLSDSHSVP